MATINGICIARPEEGLSPEELRQRACNELLRQHAQAQGWLASDDPAPEQGVISEAAAQAIEQVLASVMQPMPEPEEAALRRQYEAGAARYRSEEALRMRHILFGVSEGVDVARLRQHAEQCLLQLQRSDLAAFAEAAGRWSNCPSSTQGGELGWVTRSECVPELARELFGKADTGVLPRLLSSRHGLHIVAVDERQPSEPLPFDEARAWVGQHLRQQHDIRSLQRFLRQLAHEAEIQGAIEWEALDAPLAEGAQAEVALEGGVPHHGR